MITKPFFKKHPEVIFVLVTTLLQSGMILPVCHAQTSVPPKAVSEDQDVEVLVNTLNEVLEENRKMRKTLTDHEGNVEKLKEENGVLRGQVQRLKRTETKGGQEDQEKLKLSQEELEKLKRHAEELVSENEKLVQLKADYEKKVPDLEDKARKLEGILDKAILEGEREEYLHLIQSAQEMTNRTFVELAASKEYMQTLEHEMTDAYFNLGNLFYDMRDFDKAIVSYKKVLDIHPTHAWIHHNLAVIYDYYVHDDLQALYHYRQYLQLKPIEEEAAQIRERILEMELKKNMLPDEPIRQDYNEQYNKVPR